MSNRLAKIIATKGWCVADGATGTAKRPFVLVAMTTALGTACDGAHKSVDAQASLGGRRGRRG